MASDKPAELFGDGEGDHEVMFGKLAFHLVYQPLMDFVVLAMRTMPIAAGLVNNVVLAAFLTLVDHDSVMLGAAVDDSIDYFAVFRGHVLTEAVDILVCIGFKDLVNCHDHQLLSSWINILKKERNRAQNLQKILTKDMSNSKSVFF